LNLNAGTDVAGPLGVWKELQDAPVVLHRVVPGHPPPFLEAEHAVQVQAIRQRAVGRAGLGYRHAKAGAVTGQEAPKDAVGFFQCGRSRQAELRHQAVLEGPVGALDATLRLGALGEHGGDAELLERAAELGGLALLLSVCGTRRRAGQSEDRVAVGVETQGNATVLDDAPEQEKIALRVLLVPKQRLGWNPGGIVNRQQQRELRAPVLQPGVMAAIHLEEHAFLGHPLPSAPVLAAPLARSLRPRGPEHAPD